jgi:predicted nuclease of restriction endonuclease-like (RecB) superfamily
VLRLFTDTILFRGTHRQKALSQAVREMVCQVPWGHLANVLSGIKNMAERLYYLRATAQFGWSRNILLNQVKAGTHARSIPKGKAHNFPKALTSPLAEQAEEALKSSYNLEFLRSVLPASGRVNQTGSSKKASG